MATPYLDIEATDKYIIREFNENVNPIELKWHRDREDREITVLEGEGWFYQQDNSLPVELKQGFIIFIPKYTWHRVIKGNTNLKLKIQK